MSDILTKIENQSVLDQPSKIDGFGNKFWKDKDGLYHRDGDLPAIIWANGLHEHFKHGKLHRDGDQPARYYPNGESVNVSYYKNNMLHRAGDKPARIGKGYYDYFLNGKYIRSVNHKNGVVEV